MSELEKGESILSDEQYWYDLWEGRQVVIAGESSEMYRGGPVAREWYECINSHDVGCLASHLAENAEFVDLAAGVTIRGAQEVTQHFQRWFASFPDYNVEIKNLAVADDFITVEYGAEGTERNAVRGPSRQITSVGRHFEMHCCDVLQIRGGKLAGCRSYYDKLAMMNQLGWTSVELAA